MKANQLFIRLVLVVIITATTMSTYCQGVYQLWGTTSYGGTSDGGAIFFTKYDGTSVQKQVDFTSTNGSFPIGKLLLYNKKLYGMTRYGGAKGFGTLFEYDLLTKTYTKKIDLDGTNGSYPEGGSLVVLNDKLYGLTTYGGAYNRGVLFEYDPASSTYVKRFDFNYANGRNPNGGMLVYNNKLYGLAGGNPGDGGVLFEYDPATSTYNQKYNFGSEPDGRFPNYNLLLDNTKLYGVTMGGGINSAGSIFEFDLVSGVYTKLYDFLGGANGFRPNGGLVVLNNKLYGTAGGGDFNYGILFDFDLSTKKFTKRFDYHWNKNTGTNPTGGLLEYNSKLYGVTTNDGSAVNEFDALTNTLTTKAKFTATAGTGPSWVTLSKVPAPVAAGIPNSCESVPTITINAANANQWVPITSTAGDAIAEINANGNILGTVTTDLYVHGGSVRKDGLNQFYANRNITLTPQFQPASPVSVRLYLKGGEFEDLRDASNASGLVPPISTINDIIVYKSDDACGNKVSHALPVTGSSAANWGIYDDYVFSSSISSFSTFYFANKVYSILPIELVSFTTKVKQNTAILEWSAKESMDSKQYEIEYSKDGNNFTFIASIKAKGDRTNNSYQYNHQRLPPGLHYYRIKMVNQDGSISYSAVRLVRIASDSSFYLQMQSNPVVSSAVASVTVGQSEQLLFNLYNSSGQLIWKQKQKLSAGTHFLTLPVTLPKGFYTLLASDGEALQRVHFVKQ